jgi:hypothetical protein
MIKFPCPECKFNIPLDKEEAIYEKEILCLCGNKFDNPNFIGEKELNKYLKSKNDKN